MTAAALRHDTPGLPVGFEYRPTFLSPRQADRLLRRLWNELAWRQESIRLFGRRIAQPRLTAWIGDPEACYRYSGLALAPCPWHPLLQALRKHLELELDGRFNAVLANAYRNGRDSMGWHADDEPELGVRPLIASISLGMPRRFVVRANVGGSQWGIDLDHGSLLVMRSASQSNYRHALPKRTRADGLRINLTFRHIRPQP